MLKYTAAAFFAVTASADVQVSHSTMENCDKPNQTACEAENSCYWDVSCKIVPFTKIGDGYCADWIYPSTGTTSGAYDDVSSTPYGCYERCLALNPDYSAFYVKGTQCGCSTSTNGPCDVVSNDAYTAYTTSGAGTGAARQDGRR